MEGLKMNAAEMEIYRAVKEVQGGPVIIRHTCIICKDYLKDWDVRRGCGMCWDCRQIYFPAPKVEEKTSEPRKATLFQLKDGKYMIILD
jgi:hypothetical protein